MPERLHVGVVGGGIGRHHVRAYQRLPEQFKVVAICDLDGDRAREVATEHDVPRVFTDLEELCRVDDLDVIDICTPSYLHAAQVLQVLAANARFMNPDSLGSSVTFNAIA